MSTTNYKLPLEQLILGIKNHTKSKSSIIHQLHLISDYFRTSYHNSEQLDIVKPSINSIYNSDKLKCTEHITAIDTIQDKLATLIEKGIASGEISSEINAMNYAKRFVTIFKGAIYMSQLMNDNSYLKDTADLMDTIVTNELKS